MAVMTVMIITMMMVVMDGDDDGGVVGADGRGVVVAHAPALGQEPAGGTCRGGLPGLPARVAALSSREEALAGRPTLVARQTSAGTVGTSPDTAPAWTAAKTTLWGGTATPLLAARRLSRRWATATAPATTAGAASARSGAAGRRRWPALVRRRSGRPSFEGEGCVWARVARLSVRTSLNQQHHHHQHHHH